MRVCLFWLFLGEIQLPVLCSNIVVLDGLFLRVGLPSLIATTSLKKTVPVLHDR